MYQLLFGRLYPLSTDPELVFFSDRQAGIDDQHATLCLWPEKWLLDGYPNSLIWFVAIKLEAVKPKAFLLSIRIDQR
jgi:hypothetical protein